MISVDDVTRAHPGAARFGEKAIQHWVDVANATLDGARVADPRILPMARVWFVMHHLEKPALDLKAPHVVARSSRPGRLAANVKAPHPWAGTPHGDNLRKAVRF